MDVVLNFSNTRASSDARNAIRTWFHKFLQKFDERGELQVDVYCSKKNHNSFTPGEKFLCVVSARASWLMAPVTIRVKGENCWNTLVDACAVLRQQLQKNKKKLWKRSRYKKVKMLAIERT